MGARFTLRVIILVHAFSKGNAMKIQIIEKDEEVVKIIKSQIQLYGEREISVSILTHVSEMDLEAILSKAPDILIFDLATIETCDFDFVNSLISSDINLKVIVIIDNNNFDSRQAVKMLGISSILTKPLNLRRLHQVLNILLNQYERKLNGNEVFFAVTTKASGDSISIKETDVLAVEEARDICQIIFKDGRRLLVAERITEIEAQICSKDLLKVDRNTILNVGSIIELSDNDSAGVCRMELNNEKELTFLLSDLAVSRLRKLFSTKTVK